MPWEEGKTCVEPTALRQGQDDHYRNCVLCVPFPLQVLPSIEDHPTIAFTWCIYSLAFSAHVLSPSRAPYSLYWANWTSQWDSKILHLEHWRRKVSYWLSTFFGLKIGSREMCSGRTRVLDLWMIGIRFNLPIFCDPCLIPHDSPETDYLWADMTGLGCPSTLAVLRV